MSKIVLGIDVSKKTLDTALIFDNRTFSKQFQNSSEGFKLLAAWLASLHITEVHACLEATGIYGEAVALFLHESGHRVSVVNPLRIKGFAQSNMQRNKTDRLDARLPAGCSPDSFVLCGRKSQIGGCRRVRRSNTCKY